MITDLILKTTSGAAVALGTAILFASWTPAQAEAEICWEQTIDGTTKTVCEKISSLKAECPYTDPDNLTEVCQTATFSVVPQNQKLYLKSGPVLKGAKPARRK